MKIIAITASIMVATSAQASDVGQSLKACYENAFLKDSGIVRSQYDLILSDPSHKVYADAKSLEASIDQSVTMIMEMRGEGMSVQMINVAAAAGLSSMPNLMSGIIACNNNIL